MLVTGDFAKQFVDNLLEEGVKISCDEANGSFNSNYGCLPQYYDEEKYKRLVWRRPILFFPGI